MNLADKPAYDVAVYAASFNASAPHANQVSVTGFDLGFRLGFVEQAQNLAPKCVAAVMISRATAEGLRDLLDNLLSSPPPAPMPEKTN